MNAIVFVENFRPHLIPPIARFAKARGLATFFIAPPRWKDPEAEALFDGVVRTERWDLDTLHELVEQINRQVNVIAVTGCDVLFNAQGVPAVFVAQINETHGLPSQGSAALMRCLNKYVMRDRLQAEGVPCVDFGIASEVETALSEAERIGYPVVLKPVTGASSSLILRCANPQELRKNFEFGIRRLPKTHYHSFMTYPHVLRCSSGQDRRFDPLREFLIEKYIPGREASVECVIDSRGPHPLIVHDKVMLSESESTVYEDVLVTPPARFTPEEVQAMEEYACACLRALGLGYSFAHVELRWDPQHGPQVIEINPRVGGAYIIDSFATCAGLDTNQAQLALALGEDVEILIPKHDPPRVYGGFAFFPGKNGRLIAVDGVEEFNALPGVLRSSVNLSPGDYVGTGDYECFLVTAWTQAPDVQGVLDLYEQGKSCLRFQVDETDVEG